MRYADRILAIRDARMLRNRKRFISVRNAWKEFIRATDSMRAAEVMFRCEECLKGMTIDEIFELLGESLEET